MLLVSVAVVGGLVAAAVIWNKALTHELINVDFREGVKPFMVGENSFGITEHADGTYRLTDNNSDGPFMSVGGFARTAYWVGIRADVVEQTQPGTWVGPMCLGRGADGGQALVGYGFFIEPGGDFALVRMGPDGTNEFLRRGTDTRIETVERVSITCDGTRNDVRLVGFANGLEVVAAEDADGYSRYSDAGLGIEADHVGTGVGFTRVWARLPDEEWIP